jgi:hypothetical protein
MKRARFSEEQIILAAQLSDAVFAAQTSNHDPDLLLR